MSIFRLISFNLVRRDVAARVPAYRGLYWVNIPEFLVQEFLKKPFLQVT